MTSTDPATPERRRVTLRTRLVILASCVVTFFVGLFTGRISHDGLSQPWATLLGGALVVAAAGIALYGQLATNRQHRDAELLRHNTDRDTELRQRRLDAYSAVLNQLDSLLPIIDPSDADRLLRGDISSADAAHHVDRFTANVATAEIIGSHEFAILARSVEFLARNAGLHHVALKKARQSVPIGDRAQLGNDLNKIRIEMIEIARRDTTPS